MARTLLVCALAGALFACLPVPAEDDAWRRLETALGLPPGAVDPERLFHEADPGRPPSRDLPEAGSGGLTPDLCDDPLYGDVPPTSVQWGRVKVVAPRGMVSERDLMEAARRRDRLYGRLASTLGVVAPAPVEIAFSPNRRAAAHHGWATGRVRPRARRAEVLWPGGPDAYEAKRPGRTLARLLVAQWDDAPAHLPLLAVGLAECFDGSGRDLHRAYARVLTALGEEDDPTRLTEADLAGRRPAGAGSFVASLLDRHGTGGLRALWSALAVAPAGGRLYALDGTPLDNVEALERVLDEALRRTVGTRLSEERRAWRRALAPHLEALEAASDSLPAADLEAIAGVLRAYDQAVSRGDLEALRATLDGFYCDVWDDRARARTLRAELDRAEILETRLLAVRPTGLRNYPEVVVHAVSRQVAAGRVRYVPAQFWLERFPVGWRSTWSTRF